MCRDILFSAISKNLPSRVPVYDLNKCNYYTGKRKWCRNNFLSELLVNFTNTASSTLK